MSDTKLHHIVPRFYLERFTKDDDVELVDRHDPSKSFPVNPKKAVAETHYYSVVTDQGARDPVAENLFAREIESPAAEAIRRVVDEGRPLAAPRWRQLISAFVALQRLRGRAARRMMVEHFKECTRKMMEIATPESVLAVLGDDDPALTLQDANEMLEFARTGEENGDYKLEVEGTENSHVSTALEGMTKAAAMLNQRTWQIVEFEAPALITSDEPVALIGEGENSEPGDVTSFVRAPIVAFPTDPRHALLMIRPDLPADQERSRGSSWQADVINRQIAFNAERHIVRMPGTNHLAGLEIPDKAPAAYIVGNIVAMQLNASARRMARNVEAIQRWLARNRDE